MTAETDKFIVATFALWAGDFAFFERLLKEFSPPWNLRSPEGGVESPEDVIRATGALRLRQLWQKKGEFQKLIVEYRPQGIQIVEQPLTLQTRHLRATVWRTGEREFSMQAYLRDLAWEEELFARARREASRNRPPQRRFPPGLSEAVGPAPERLPGKALGDSWTVAGNPFLQIELTDLGLLDVSALWTELELPESGESITRPLFELLRVLDEPAAD